MIFGLKTTIFLHDRNKTKLVHATLSVCYYHSYLPSLISALLGIWWPRAASATTRLQSFMKLLQATCWIFHWNNMYCASQSSMLAKSAYEIFYCRSGSWNNFCELLKYCRMLDGLRTTFIFVNLRLKMFVSGSMFPLTQQDFKSFYYCSSWLVKIMFFSKRPLIMI